jgi:hypothetical protein
MKALLTAFSHLNLEKKDNKVLNKDWSKPIKLEEIQKSSPMKVNSYDDLVKNVAQILYRNRNLTLFYRGQGADYTEDGKTIILPSIYRKKDNTKLLLKERFKILEVKSNKLKKLFREQSIPLVGTIMLNKYPEIAWSILQHYETCGTPLLDLTHSLHVACSFAFDQNKGDSGIIYVIGMPYQSDAIGYNTFEELVNIRLLSVCPPQAQRPFFQEGYLAGPFPNYQLNNPKRVTQFDFARRLVAKFEIPTNNKDFWGNGFGRIPEDKLYPSNDMIKDICLKLNN